MTSQQFDTGIDNEKPRRSARIVAEIGCNHLGEIDIAKKMVNVARNFCNVDYVKFQKRNPVECLTREQFRSPHPVPSNSFGDTYGAHREYLEFTFEQHLELIAHCQGAGIGYSTSVWDITSARQMASLPLDFLKVPSALNLHFDMLAVLCDEFSGQIHISLGMTGNEEEERIIEYLMRKGRAKDVVLYACTSAYPVPFSDVCLHEIVRLKNHYGDIVHQIGFSGHHGGIAVDVAAFTLGAQWIERHFTLNRSWKGTDHAASLEPDGMRRVARDIENVSLALAYKDEEILDIEIHQRGKLKWMPRESVPSE